MFRPEPLATALLQPPEINQALRKSYRLITIESLKGRILSRMTPAEERGMKLALAMLAKSKQPIDANEGRPEPPRATATQPESPDSGGGNDRSRAAEHGRGRQATSPWRIPWRGWKDILWRAYEKMNDDRLLAVAGGVVFYALLALFPAVTAFVSLYGLVADASTIDQHLSLAAGILPSGAVDILHEQLTRLKRPMGRHSRVVREENAKWVRRVFGSGLGGSSPARTDWHHGSHALRRLRLGSRTTKGPAIRAGGGSCSRRRRGPHWRRRRPGGQVVSAMRCSALAWPMTGSTAERRRGPSRMENVAASFYFVVVREQSGVA